MTGIGKSGIWNLLLQIYEPILGCRYYTIIWRKKLFSFSPDDNSSSVGSHARSNQFNSAVDAMDIHRSSKNWPWPIASEWKQNR
ncbi:MAG: hypothetical protein AB2699_19540, partial [Candidatus Thiodiazotropha taylori]